MRYIVLIAIIVGAIAIGSAGFAAPKVDLTVADQAKPGTMSYEPGRIEFALDGTYANVTLVGENGELKSIVYTGDAARAFLDGLPMLNALLIQVLKQVVKDGQIDGVVAQ